MGAGGRLSSSTWFGSLVVVLLVRRTDMCCPNGKEEEVEKDTKTRRRMGSMARMRDRPSNKHTPSL